MLFLDTETVGLVGPIVLMQYAEDEGPVHLHEVWNKPVRETLRLIERICEQDVCAFNLSFDWFHINKLYGLFRCVGDKSKYPNVDEIVRLSEESRECVREYALRPKKALCLLLHTRKTEWQALMDRRPIRIRRIPTEIAYKISGLLSHKLPFSDIFFTRRKAGYQWEVEQDNDDPNFSDIVLKFGASSSLKPLCSEIFKVSTYEFPIPKELYPEESPYNPLDIRWARVITQHVNYWSHNKNARSYAEDDVILMRRLYHHYGNPEPGDDDSELAACVGAVRWRGFDVDTRLITELMIEYLKAKEDFPCNVNSSHDTRQWLMHGLPIEEQLAVKNTSAKTLELLERVYDGTELGRRAGTVIQARSVEKRFDILEKLHNTGRFHPDFKVIGARSSRMSGGGGFGGNKSGSINPQGIPRDPKIRRLFTLGHAASGGDFKSFEVVIAHAASRDKNIERDIQSGRNVHAAIGSFFMDDTYEDILASKGTAGDLYTPSKATGFGWFYGAETDKLSETAGVSQAAAEFGIEELRNKYRGYTAYRDHIYSRFCSMQQPGGVGTAIEWAEPPEHIESLLGYRRYYTLENRVCRALFELAQNLYKMGIDSGKQVKRKDKVQTESGAAMSALYACAFNIQAQSMRSAANHVIQSTGAQICKRLHRRIWDLQPVGIHEWIVAPMNIHDEVVCSHASGFDNSIESVVMETVESFKGVVPLLAIDWRKNIKNWSELK